MPIELARWKVGRTFHLARPLYRPRRHPGFLRDSILAACWEPRIILLARLASRAALRRRNTFTRGNRSKQTIADATAFILKWGAQAQAFGWTVPELFGLHPVPEQPTANYSRLSRVDDLGLVWLLRSRPVVALTETTASIQGATAVLTYRKINKPALGPVDSPDDWGAT
jgi:hypothetical protein